MQRICALKIGGSVVTDKGVGDFNVRRELLAHTFSTLKKVLDSDPELQLIVVHGAGGHIHRLARQYKLAEGTEVHPEGRRGAMLTKLATQKLNRMVVKEAFAAGLSAVALHTGSLITQKNGVITACDTRVIEQTLVEGYVPVLYGEMVMDSELGMSVCSGDSIIAHLAQKLFIRELYFATDVVGIYSEDPHTEKKAVLIEELSVRDALGEKIKLSESHNVDVTGGLRGKIESCKSIFENSAVESVQVFSGFDPENFKKVFIGESFPHTIIKK